MSFSDNSIFVSGEQRFKVTLPESTFEQGLALLKEHKVTIHVVVPKFYLVSTGALSQAIKEKVVALAGKIIMERQLQTA